MRKFLSIKIFGSCVLLVVLTHCGRSKPEFGSTTSKNRDSSDQKQRVFPSVNLRNVPSDQELDKMIDLVEDTSTQDIVHEISDEDDSNVIPPEIYQQPSGPSPEKPRDLEKPKKHVLPLDPFKPEKPEEVPVANGPSPTPDISQSQKPVPNKPRITQELKNQAIHYPDNGALKNSASLLARRETYDGKSPFEFSKRTVVQKRFFATDDLIEFIDFLANAFQSIEPGHKLLISDLSKVNGGPICCALDRNKKTLFKSGKAVLSHLSHQNGLDADIAYIAAGEKDKFFSLRNVSIRKNVNLKVQFDLFKQAVGSNMIDFILIFPTLKKELCVEAFKEGAFENDSENNIALETLKRLIPDTSHHDHFHVRINCDPKVHSGCLTHKRSELKHGCRITEQRQY